MCQMVAEHQEKVHAAYFFLVNKLINQPIMPPTSGAGSSQIPPTRLNSSKILFSFFAIIIIFEQNYSSTSIASMKSAYSASNSLIFLIVISFLLEASINSVLE